MWANSYFYRHTRDIEDSSYGTQQILTGPVYLVTGLPAQPYLWDGQHYHDQVASETAPVFRPHPQHQWHGGSLLREHPLAIHDPADLRERPGRPGDHLLSFWEAGVSLHGPAWPNNEIWQQTNPGTEEDKSIFGEIYYKFLRSGR